jgi:hydroxyacylglutathione hydrolase
MSVEPGNELLVKRVEEIKAKRSRGEPTVPSLMGEEKLTNPFLRGDVSDEIKKNVGATIDDDDATIFLKTRQGKDNFRG